MPAKNNPIIVALDTPRLDSALQYAHELSDSVGCFKVGLELLTAEGLPRVLEAFRDLPLFVDVKFSDIPNTVGAATMALTRFPISFFDVHASCGLGSLRAAATYKGSAKLLAVTVLTSLTDSECRSIFGDSSQISVAKFAHMALEAGADGIVCAPQDLAVLSPLPELKPLIKVTAGVRPSWAQTNDQKRSMTPAEAMRRGADHLVIGRPILKPPANMTSKQAAQKILEEINGVASES